MKTTLLIAVALSLAILSCADELGSVQQTAEAEFAGMVTKKLGALTGFTLLNYGCHCGPGSPDDTVWHDEVDNCCRIHDEAYNAAPKQIKDCSCRTQAYAYTYKDGVVTCAAQQANACATYCCEADRKFVNCVADELPLNNQLANIDRKTRCPMAECRTDDCCEVGFYCDRGTCRMYCDPGDWVSDDDVDVSVACDPLHEEPVQPVDTQQPVD